MEIERGKYKESEEADMKKEGKKVEDADMSKGEEGKEKEEAYIRKEGKKREESIKGRYLGEGVEDGKEADMSKGKDGCVEMAPLRQLQSCGILLHTPPLIRLQARSQDFSLGGAQPPGRLDRPTSR